MLGWMTLFADLPGAEPDKRTRSPISRALTQRRQVAAERLSAQEWAEQLQAAVNLLAEESLELRRTGVQALVRMADEGDRVHRQACIDALCAAVRAAPGHYRGRAGQDGDGGEPAAWRSDRQFRHELLSIIPGHLRDDAKVSWRGYDLDFTGAVFDNSGPDAISFTSASFTGARFAGGEVSFAGAEFAGANVKFARARFTGAKVTLLGA